jgi:hypothetical protein
MDRVDSLSNPDFNVAEIDWLLNEAQLIFIKQRMNPTSNSKQRGFEQSQKRIDDLGNLVIKFPLQPGVVPQNPSSGVYELPLQNLTFPYLYLISSWVEAEVTPGCTKKVPLKFVQHDDYRYALEDPFNSAGEEFIPYNIGRASNSTNEALYIYSPYPISNVFVEYIKYPSRVSFGTYQYIDGIIYPEQTLETSPATHPEIVDIACVLAGSNTQNPEYIQLRQTKTLIHE